MLNNKNKFELIDSASYGDNFCGIVDCEISDQGDIYILESIKNETEIVEFGEYD